MKRHLVSSAAIFLFLVSSAAAQRPPGGISRPPSRTSRPPTPTLPDTTSQRLFLFGKVVIDDGTELTESANIQTICKGQKRTEARTDSHGNFSFEFSSRVSGAGSLGDADSSVSDSGMNRGTQRDWHDCELQASLPGFLSQPIMLAGKVSMVESNDVGKLVLHRFGQVEGSTISVTSALAPGNANKAMEKGLDQARTEKWDEAQKSLEKAVEIYPKYAAAWFELGRVQLHEKDAAGARHSFSQSVEADSRFVSPYQALAQLAARDKQWRELADVTAKWIALNSMSADAWFLNAAGNYYLGSLEVAEKSARQAVKLDEAHQIPKIEYLLGMILIERHDYLQASEHMTRFLHLATKPNDVEEAQKQLAEIAKLSADVQVPVLEKK